MIEAIESTQLTRARRVSIVNRRVPTIFRFSATTLTLLFAVYIAVLLLPWRRD